MTHCPKCQKNIPLMDINFCPYCGLQINPTTLNTSNTDTFTDERDGETYKLVQIGKQIWMAENLRYNPQKSDVVAYDNDEDKAKQYGRLYSYDSIKNYKIIPKGFHLPSQEDYFQLIDFVSQNNNGEGTGTSLKSVKGWKFWVGKPTDYQVNQAGLEDALEDATIDSMGKALASFGTDHYFKDINKAAREALASYDTKYNNLEGTDRFGFKALPAGHAFKSRDGLITPAGFEIKPTYDCYDGLGTQARFWLDHNCCFYLGNNLLNCGCNRITDTNGLFYSIRCLKDDID